MQRFARGEAGQPPRLAACSVGRALRAGGRAWLHFFVALFTHLALAPTHGCRNADCRCWIGCGCRMWRFKWLEVVRGCLGGRGLRGGAEGTRECEHMTVSIVTKCDRSLLVTRYGLYYSHLLSNRYE